MFTNHTFSSLLDEFLSAGEHSLQNTAGPYVVSVLWITYLKFCDLAERGALSFFATLPECVDRDVGYFKSHLDLFDLVGGPADVVVFV